MRRLFGEVSCEVFFAYLKNRYSLTKNEILNNPEAFANALGEVLGSTATIFEGVIVKELYSNLGLEPEEREEYTLVKCIRRIRNIT